MVVTGASGLLGSMLTLLARQRFELLALTRSRRLNPDGFQTQRLDLAAEDEVTRVLDDFRPDTLIHCAALTSVDRCEKDPLEALRQNCEIPSRLALWCRRKEVRMVHLSTDAVFDGERGGYEEGDEARPVNEYGTSKRAGEVRVFEANPAALVVRTNLFGCGLDGPAALVGWMLFQLKSGKDVPGWTDVRFNPLFTGTLAAVLLDLTKSERSGPLHLAARNSMTKFDFARIIAATWGYDPERVRPTRSVDASLKTRRPLDTTLSVDLAERILGRRVPSVEDEVVAMKGFVEDGAASLAYLSA
jgi:dTDP-4-dehydrorhamnose reductase